MTDETVPQPPVPVLDWKEVIEYTAKQIERDRSYFDRLVKYSLGVIAVGTAIGAFLVGNTLSDVRRQAREQIQQRLDVEFRQENIKRTIAEALEKQAGDQIRFEISRQVKSQIDAQKSTFLQIIQNEANQYVRGVLTPRKLSAKQKQLLCAPLQAGTSPKEPFQVWGLPDWEGQHFAEQIVDILSDSCHWNAVFQATQMDRVYSGNRLLVKDLAAVPQPVRALAAALHKPSQTYLKF